MDALRNIGPSGAECRYEDAIYRADGTATLLTGSPDQGYGVSGQASVSELISGEPDGWTDLDFMHRAESTEYVVLAGETSYGGAGFVALRLRSSSEFLWVLHLSNCNNVQRVAFEADAVVAMTDALYPTGARFMIPIRHPERLEVAASAT